MPGQYCPSCGAARAAGPCSCASDLTDTAVLPHIEGPPLVRPYVHAPAEPEGAVLPPPEPPVPGRPPLPPRTADQGAPAADDLGMFPMDEHGVPAHVAYSRAAGRQAAYRRRRHRAVLLVAAVAVPAAAGVGFALSGSGDGSHRVADPSPSVSALVADPSLLSPGPATRGAHPHGTAVAAATAPATSAPATSASASPSTAAPTTARPTGSPSATSAPLVPQVTPPAATGRPSAGATSSPARTPSATASSTGPRTLSLGMSGPDVEDLQRRLRRAWIYRGKPTGQYDQRTADAVAQFQQSRNIQGDPRGVYGPNTRARLEQETS
ncbi:peptidoglycan-binding domain-containing protein [Peterkaempfera griseoplana]|uniref:peptidoglycan-binding domain-containing protein n=1 Tax=Peterkaempfera griseoplana TaxID=66896 RepID=UPI0006E25B6B|nr:peptidoglycan-binding domain-containing protein [Peterkaempfera griseoplana]